MPQRRLFFLDANRLTAYRWQGGKLSAEAEFYADTAGISVFASYLKKYAGSIYTILADVGEEGFQVEDVPHVTGRDRTALLQRRLSQYFYGTPYVLTIPLGREKGGRRDEKILFAGLTQPRHFKPWIDAMLEAGAQLAGIYSAPLALASLLSHRRNVAGPLLLLSITRAGVRQTFFNDGKLYFSRLSALVTGSMEEAAVACAVEARKTYQYLAGQRLVKRGTPLDVKVLAHPAQQNGIRAHCQPTSELRFSFIDLLQEAKQAHLKTLPTDSHCELLLLHQLVRHTPTQQFAPPPERRFYRLWQWRFGLVAAAVVLFVGSVLYAGKQYSDTQQLNADASRMLDEAQRNQQRYQQTLDSLPKVAISHDELRALVTRFEEVEKRSPMLESIYLPLSHALDATPGVRVERIDWKATAKSSEGDGPNSGKKLPITVAGNYFAIADVDARLPISIANDHRAMLQLVNQLLAEAAKEPAIHVQVTQMPFDVESGKTIKGSADISATQTEAPHLAFRLIRAVQ